MRYSFGSLARPLAGLSIALAVPSAAIAQPAVMTFTPIACATGNSNDVGSTYTESGFTLFTPDAFGFATWCADEALFGGSYAGPGMFINTTNGTASLTKNGGGPFSINGIELAHLYGGQFGAQSFTFIGNVFGGGTVSQTFTIGPQVAHPTFAPFLFDATWTNLASVDFAQQVSTYYQFTNILLNGTATTVPEPVSIALLGTGLVGVYGAVRRHRKHSA